MNCCGTNYLLYTCNNEFLLVPSNSFVLEVSVTNVWIALFQGDGGRVNMESPVLQRHQWTKRLSLKVTRKPTVEEVRNCIGKYPPYNMLELYLRSFGLSGHAGRVSTGNHSYSNCPWPCEGHYLLNGGLPGLDSNQQRRNGGWRFIPAATMFYVCLSLISIFKCRILYMTGCTWIN